MGVLAVFCFCEPVWLCLSLIVYFLRLFGLFLEFFNDSVRWCNTHSRLDVWLGCLEFLAVIGAEGVT